LGDRFYLRESVISKLILAQDKLQKIKPNAFFRVVYGYRHPDVQITYFQERKYEVSFKYPNITEDELIFKTHLLTAFPDVAGHCTGGAIDITIEDENGEIDMGCKIADFSSNLIETYSDGLTDEQIKNREILRNVLIEQDFAPFDGEWWHFSYGDREWAFFYNKNNAIYDKINLS
jgi:zinc D-Ala-D-Ala dipeptidase